MLKFYRNLTNVTENITYIWPENADFQVLKQYACWSK